MKTPLRLVFSIVCALGSAGAAYGQSFTDGTRVAGARPGKCPGAPEMLCHQNPHGSVPILDDNCHAVTTGVRCLNPSAYYCGIGFVPIFRAESTKSPYYRQSEIAAIDAKQLAWRQRVGVGPAFKGLLFRATRMPSGADAVRWMKAGYCDQLRLLEGLFSSGEHLAQKMDDDGGLIARWNSTYGGTPSLKALKQQFAAKSRSLRFEFNQFLLSEFSGASRPASYYAGRIAELNILAGVLDNLDATAKVVGNAIVSTADRATKLAKKVQKVLIKVAGKIVLLTTGNRLFECLTETAIEVGGDLTTKLLKGKEISLDTFGKPALKKLILNCMDAFTSGPGSMMVGALMKPFESMFERLKGVVKNKVQALWKGSALSRKVASLAERLDFLVGPDVVDVLTGAADEVVPEFVADATTRCLPDLLSLKLRKLVSCLGGAAKRALKALPLGLFDGTISLLEKKVAAAGDAFKRLGRSLTKLGFGDNKTLDALLAALSESVAQGAIRSAKSCRKHLVGLKSPAQVLPCLAKALVSNVKKLRQPAGLAKKAAKDAIGAAPHAVIQGALERLAKEASQGAAELVAAIDRANSAAEDVQLVPPHVVAAIRKAARSATDAGAKKFARALRAKCLKAPAPKTPLAAYVRASARCVADAATTALKVAGAAALNALLKELTQFALALAKPGKDVADKLVARIRTIATMLGLALPKGGPSTGEVAAALAKDAKGVARKAGACVGTLQAASQAASRKHERLSSMARALVGSLNALGPCLARAVGKRSGASE